MEPNNSNPLPELCPGKIAIPVHQGTDFYIPDDIIMLEGDSSYSKMFIRGNPHPVALTRTLKEMERHLPKDKFFRIHDSYIINMNEVNAHRKEDGGYLLMSNNEKAYISRSKLDAVRRMIAAKKKAD